MGKRKQDTQIAIKNRKAEFLYYLHTSYTAGIVLTGTEIKSIRAGRANITDAYCSFINNELWVHNMHISEYAQGSYNNHQPKRDRKLLLQRKEMRKLMTKLNERGYTIIPTLHFSTSTRPSHLSPSPFLHLYTAIPISPFSSSPPLHG